MTVPKKAKVFLSSKDGELTLVIDGVVEESEQLSADKIIEELQEDLPENMKVVYSCRDGQTYVSLKKK